MGNGKPPAPRPALTWRHHLEWMLGGAMAALLLACFLKLAVSLRRGPGAYPLDEYLLALMHHARTPTFTRIALDLTALGSPAFLGLVSVGAIILLFFIRHDRSAALQVVAASAGAALWLRLGKSIVERSRPDVLQAVRAAGGYSYPSGHTLTATALYLTTGLIAGRAMGSRSKRLVVMALTLLVIFLIGLTRIYLGVHFPTDVLGGILLGTAWALLLEAGASYQAARRI